ncbi:MAG: glycosyltransferase family 2 protein, partial [Candidatus Omnitrophica bacterium]|nr:glycosyltransferase family 2 protein [Candidatus Omnitrophota bacterium]
MKTSIIIPVYNEEATIKKVLDVIKAVDLDKEIVIVDDCSTDKTRDILKEINDPRVRIFYHDKNQGKGAALRTGFEKATGEIIMVQDADLEYDPREYPHVLRLIKDGSADVVYGSRFLGDHRV